MFTGNLQCALLEKLMNLVNKGKIEEAMEELERLSDELRAFSDQLEDLNANQENLKAYLNILEDSDVQFFGITDYFSFDGYLNVIEYYRQNFPNGKKV